MKKPGSAIAIAISALLSLASAASAQNAGSGSIRINMNVLKPVTCPHAPLQIDLVDDRPIVHDHRSAAPAVQWFEIPVTPLGAAANDGVQTVSLGGLPLPGTGARYRMESPAHPTEIRRYQDGPAPCTASAAPLRTRTSVFGVLEHGALFSGK